MVSSLQHPPLSMEGSFLLLKSGRSFLDKHEQYMHLLSDSSIDSMPEPDLKTFLDAVHESTDGLQVCELRERV